MRFIVWTCRLIMVVVIAAFAATVFYMTHNVGADMDAVMPTLKLITVIGTALVGLVWPLIRRYWQALFLLVSLGVLRGLFGEPGLDSLEHPLLTPFQSDYLWISIGVVALALVACLAVRAVMSDRALRALKQAQSPSPGTLGATDMTTAEVAPPAPLMVTDSQVDVPPATETGDAEATSEPAPQK